MYISIVWRHGLYHLLDRCHSAQTLVLRYIAPPEPPQSTNFVLLLCLSPTQVTQFGLNKARPSSIRWVWPTTRFLRNATIAQDTIKPSTSCHPTLPSSSEMSGVEIAAAAVPVGLAALTEALRLFDPYKNASAEMREHMDVIEDLKIRTEKLRRARIQIRIAPPRHPRRQESIDEIFMLERQCWRVLTIVNNNVTAKSKFSLMPWTVSTTKFNPKSWNRADRINYCVRRLDKQVEKHKPEIRKCIDALSNHFNRQSFTEFIANY